MKPGLYKHYKGNCYNVLGLCRHSESLEELVIYQALYGDYRLWVRPKELFKSTIEIDGKTQKRFEFVEPLFEKPPLVETRS